MSGSRNSPPPWNGVRSGTGVRRDAAAGDRGRGLGSCDREKDERERERERRTVEVPPAGDETGRVVGRDLVRLRETSHAHLLCHHRGLVQFEQGQVVPGDRKSTRLNSSH